jgi:uncharacterized repeat protein (TIGR01451 family)
MPNPIYPSIRRIAALVGAACLAGITAQAQQQPRFEWVKALYSSPAFPALAVKVNESAIDQTGNSYLGFAYQGSLVADSANTLADGRHNGVVKYTANGQVAWMHDFGLYTTVSDIAIDPDGNVVVAGSFTNVMFLPNQSMQAQLTDIFITKWNAAGQLLWAKQGLAGSNPATRLVSKIAIDPAGSIYLTGTADAQSVFGPTAQIGSPFLVTSMPRAMYCAKYTADGDLVWVKGSRDHAPDVNGGLQVGDISGIGADANGHVILVGELPGRFSWDYSTSILGGGSVITPDNIFWITLDAATGQYQNGFSGRSSSPALPRLAVDRNGNSYLAQMMSDDVTLNGVSIPLPPVAGTGVLSALYVAKVSSLGIPTWTQTFSSSRRQQVFDVRDIAVNDSSQVFLAGALGSADTVRFGNTGVFLPPTVGATAPYAACLDAASGATNWAVIAGSSTSLFQIGSSISANNAGQVILAGAYSDDRTQFGSLIPQVPGGQVNGPKLFTAMLSSGQAPQPAVQNYVGGIVFVDTNANGVKDSTESPVRGIVLSAGAFGPYGVSDSLGYYRIEFGTGVFTLTVGEPLLNYTYPAIIQGPITVGSLGSVFLNNQHVPLVPIPLRPDGRITLTAYTDAEPGQPLRYRLTAENTGTAPTIGGSISLDFDARLVYGGASLPGATVTGSRLTAPAPVLLPGERRDFDLTFQVPVNAPLNTTLACAVTMAIPNDPILVDNTGAAPRQVVATRRAMAVEVDHLTLNASQVAANEWLTYTLRFRNDGVATATDVTIANALSGAHVRLASVQVLASSHPLALALQNNAINFTLRGANLPTFSQNAATSVGFVTFRVRTQSGLPVGTDIRLTSTMTLTGQVPSSLTVATRVSGVTATANVLAAEMGAVIWPIPAQDNLNISSRATGELTVVLLDGLGRTVRTARISAENGQLSVANLPTGVYTLRASGAAVFTRRISVVAN